MFKPTIHQLHPYTPEKPLAVLKEELGLPQLVRMSANENHSVPASKFSRP